MRRAFGFVGRRALTLLVFPLVWQAAGSAEEEMLTCERAHLQSMSDGALRFLQVASKQSPDQHLANEKAFAALAQANEGAVSGSTRAAIPWDISPGINVSSAGIDNANVWFRFYDKSRRRDKGTLLKCGLFMVSAYLLSIACGSGSRKTQSDEIDKSLRHALLPVLLWMMCSFTLMIFNKWIMLPDGADFAFPIFISTIHMFTSSVVLWMMRLARPALFPGLVSLPWELVRPLMVPAMGIAAFSSISIVFSNIAVKHLSVAFMNMMKAANPGYALIIAVILRTMDSQTSLLHVSLAIVVMLGGTVINCFGEIQLSIIGLFFFICGVFAEQFRLVLLKGLLSSAKFEWDPLSTLAVTAPMALVFMAIPAALFEGHHLPYTRLASDAFLQQALVMDGLVAVALNIAYVCLLEVVSPLTFTVCGVGKDMVTGIISISLVGGTITPLQVLGYSVSISGFAYYDYLKTKQGERPHPNTSNQFLKSGDEDAPISSAKNEDPGSHVK